VRKQEGYISIVENQVYLFHYLKIDFNLSLLNLMLLPQESLFFNVYFIIKVLCVICRENPGEVPSKGK